MMRAVVLEEFGGALTLAEVGKPVAGPGQVLVRVAASGVNPLETKIAAVDPALLARKPAALTMREAAALPRSTTPPRSPTT
jgi:NADPH:quinone reductase-like Zn-dependent oxidoreductase